MQGILINLEDERRLQLEIEAAFVIPHTILSRAIEGQLNAPGVARRYASGLKIHAVCRLRWIALHAIRQQVVRITGIAERKRISASVILNL